MAVAARAGVPPFLMAVMAGNGVLAGTLSPFAPTGLVAHGVMDQIGLGGYEWYTYAWNALAHAVVGIGGFFAFGGWRLFGQSAAHTAAADAVREPLETRHWLTAAGIGALIVTVVGLGVDVGMAALVIVCVLVLLRAADEAAAIKRMPWGVILMVTGVSVLIAMVREAGGLELFTAGVAAVSSPATLAPLMAFGAGVISVYSSTSGVVLPAFLPMVPDLAARVAGVNPLDLAWALAVGASLVDLSSLSTVGALFMAGAAADTDHRRLFNQLLAWGFSMAAAGALVAWLWFV
jgi:di/tricarboxylate transporter